MPALVPEAFELDAAWPDAGAHTVLFGVIARIDERLSFDGGFRVGRESDMPLGEVRVGFTWGVDLGGTDVGDARGTKACGY